MPICQLQARDSIWLSWRPSSPADIIMINDHDRFLAAKSPFYGGSCLSQTLPPPNDMCQENLLETLSTTYQLFLSRRLRV